MIKTVASLTRRQLRLTKRRLILGSVLFLLLVSISSLGWLWTANTAKGTYTAGLTGFKADTVDVLAELVAQFKALDTTTSSNERAKQLQTLDNAMNNRIIRLPQLPQAFGVGLLSQEEIAKQKAIEDALVALRTAARKARAYIEYKITIAALFKEVSGKSSNNLDQLKALHNDWRTAHTKLNQTEPSSAATEVHKELLTKTDAVAKTLSELVALYEKKDNLAFAVKRQEFEGKLSSLRESHKTVSTTSQLLDQELAASQEKLRSLIGD